MLNICVVLLRVGVNDACSSDGRRCSYADGLANSVTHLHHDNMKHVIWLQVGCPMS